MSDGVAELATAVPDIRSASWGRDVTGKGDNYHYALVLDFADRAAYERYRAIPRISASSKPSCARTIEKVRVQYELDTNRAGEIQWNKSSCFATAADWIDGNKDAIAGLTDLIWDYAEPGFCETRSAAALCELAAANGFDVKTRRRQHADRVRRDFRHRPTAHRA